jgi:hypothetical protein
MVAQNRGDYDSRQRSILGAEAFRIILADQLDAEGLTSILEVLDKFEAAQTQT